MGYEVKYLIEIDLSFGKKLHIIVHIKTIYIEHFISFFGGKEYLCFLPKISIITTPLNLIFGLSSLFILSGFQINFKNYVHLILFIEVIL